MHKIKRPLVVPALLALSGAWLGYTARAFNPPFLAIALVLAMAWVLMRLLNRNHPWLAGTALLLFFAHLTCQRATAIEGSRLREVLTDEYVEGVGRLVKNPLQGRNRTVFVMELEKLRVGREERPCHQRIRLSVRGSVTGFYRGDRLMASFKVFPSCKPCNFGLSKEGQLSAGIAASAYSKSAMLLEKLSSSPLSFFYRWKERAQLRAAQLQEPAASFVMALLLANPYYMESSSGSALRRAGIYHFMVISGAHVGILIFAVWQLGRFLGLRRRKILWLQIAMLLLFVLWVEESPAVLRASGVALLIFAGRLLYRDVDYINLLAASLLLSLFINPLSFLSPGFQFTYLITLILVLYLEEFSGSSFLRKALFVSYAGFLASAPLTLYHFHRLNLLAPLNNLLALLTVPVLMLLGGLYLLGLGPAGKLLVPASKLLTLLEGLDFATLHSPFFPLPALLLCLALILAFRKRPVPASLSLLILVLFGFLPQKGWQQLEVVFLDVGQADAVLVKCPPSKAFLYDAGGSRNPDFDVGERIVVPALWAEGVKELEALFVSHYHPDHAGGVRAVVREFRPGRIYYSEVAVKEPLYRYIASLPRARRVTAGSRLQVGQCRIEVLHPPPARGEFSDNENSMVLLVEYRDFSLLLTGDIGAEVEERLASRLNRVKVLKLAHHGSRRSSSEAFLDVAAPQLAVASCGLFNPYGFPSGDVLRRLGERKIRLFSTAWDGAVKITSDGERIWVERCCPRLKTLLLQAGFDKLFLQWH